LGDKDDAAASVGRRASQRHREPLAVLFARATRANVRMRLPGVLDAGQITKGSSLAIVPT